MSKSSIQKAEAAHHPLFTTAYLRSLWSAEYDAWRSTDTADVLLERLRNWAAKDWQKETSAEGTFVEQFFKKTWGYTGGGEEDSSKGYTLEPQYAVKNAGQGGKTGQADIALGHFGQQGVEPVPQVLGEFKDNHSGLDKPQSRTNPRSPVQQCFDYLQNARQGRNSKVLPTWALVTDMNEFRLYISGNTAQFQRFVIRPKTGDPAVSLLEDSEEARFQRFLFGRVFHAEWLLTTTGRSPLEKLLGEQLTQERALEADFYKEYQAYRQHLFATLCHANPEYEEQGRSHRLVGLTQRLLDRFIFVLYCEDMGAQLGFPPDVLKKILLRESTDEFYMAEGQTVWDRLRRLFETMRDGGPFGRDRIHKFNGGLFASDPDLDDLRVPNAVFCARNQGESATRLLAHPKTLLFFAAKYNFGATDDGAGKTLTLTALGRIFEQSITDLEVMEAHASGRESLAEITKRKRDGVYYTPEWVTQYIVEQTVGLRLSEIRNELGFEKIGIVTDEQISANRTDGRKASVVKEYEKALHAYSKRLGALKVLDPACGSGAFLIQAFQFLYGQRQWIAAELERVTGTLSLFDTHAAMSSVLADNLYGVDINAESIEITRLALWLHTALPDRPLTSLDKNIRCGNSLVSTDFIEQLGREEDAGTPDALHRVNPFRWEDAFPDVFERENSGFDCVIGNPPYVKLQNFRRVLEDQAEYLLHAKKADGSPRYESTQTGNFDIYLPFIERGVELLNRAGKLGYIAPSVWLKNEYGAGLRRFVHTSKCLHGWVDFKSYQVFTEATTYTAIQFFGGSPAGGITHSNAGSGLVDLAMIGDPARPRQSMQDYDSLTPKRAWNFYSTDEAELMDRLGACDRLSSATLTAAIFQGIKTSADPVFLLPLVNGWSASSPLQVIESDSESGTTEMETTLLRPVADARGLLRYARPEPRRALIFPYGVDGDGPTELVDHRRLSSIAPAVAQYLGRSEATLRARERGRFDVPGWYCFSRPQSLERQVRTKLLVAGTAPELRIAIDAEGALSTLGGRIYSIEPASRSTEDLYFLAGVLNSPVPNFVFVRIARPKAHGYFDAETQFLGPLPIPSVDDEQKGHVARLAKQLEQLHSRHAEAVRQLDRRLSSSHCLSDKRPEAWFWADLARDELKRRVEKEAPAGVGKREMAQRVKAMHGQRLAAHLEGLDVMLRPGAVITIELVEDELKVLISGAPALELYHDSTEVEFIAAQWRHSLRSVNVTVKFSGKRLVNKLRELRRTSNSAVVKKVVVLDRQIQSLDVQIAKAEAEINALIYSLYGLTEEEIRLVEAG